MTSNDIGQGVCLGIGGTNARVSICKNNTTYDFRVRTTPAHPEEFFNWMATEIMDAADKGARWAVIGIPGLVSEVEGRQAVGPLPNVPGLSDKAHILEDELATHPNIKKLLAEGFTIRAVNDGLLAAYAAAAVYGSDSKAVASFIMGTGVGGAIVRRTTSGTFRPSESLFEIGHVPLGHNHDETFETSLSGTGLQRKHGLKAEEMDGEHEAWQEAGTYIGKMVMMISLIGGVDLVVTCGGVGSNAYQHYQPALEDYLQKFRTSPNTVHRLTVPKVIAVAPEDSQAFEMRGAEGVMRHYLSEK